MNCVRLECRDILCLHMHELSLMKILVYRNTTQELQFSTRRRWLEARIQERRLIEIPLGETSTDTLDTAEAAARMSRQDTANSVVEVQRSGSQARTAAQQQKLKRSDNGHWHPEGDEKKFCLASRRIKQVLRVARVCSSELYMADLVAINAFFRSCPAGQTLATQRNAADNNS